MSDLARIYIEVNDKELIRGTINLNKYAKAADGATKSTNKFKEQTHRLSSGFKVFGRDLSRYLTLPLTIAGGVATKFSMDLSKGMGNIQALLPDAGSRIYELQDAVREMGIVSGRSFAEMTEGMYQTISAFQDGGHAIGIFNAAVKASIAGNASTAQSIGLLSAVTKAYGDTSAQAVEKVSDLAFEAVRLGQTTFPELAGAMQVVTDRAEFLGVSQEELFASFATLTGVIGDASMVATRMRSTLASLDNPTDAMIELFNELGVSTGKQLIQQYGLVESFVKIAEAVEKTGRPMQEYIRRIEGISAVERLASTQYQKYTSDLDAMRVALGATDTAVENVTEGIDKWGHRVRQQKQRLKTLYGILGENLIPILAKFLTQLNDMLEYFTKLPKPVQEFATSVAILLAAMGPLMILVGSLFRAFELFATLKTAAWFASLSGVIAGVLPIILGMAAAVAVLGTVYQKYLEKQEEQEKILTTVQDRFYTLNSYIDKNTDVTQINYRMNRMLLEQYPELAGSIDQYKSSVQEAVAAVEELNKQETARALKREIDGLRELQNEYSTFQRGVMDYQFKIAQAYKSGDVTGAKVLEEGLKSYRQFYGGVLNDYTTFFNMVKERAKKFGFELSESLNLYRIFNDAGKDAGDGFGEGLLETDGTGKIKTWQEWFEEITGVVKERFGKSGYLAGKLFGNSFQEGLDLENLIKGQAGMELRLFSADDLKDQQQQIQDALTAMVNIPKDEIDEIFRLAGYNAEETDNAVQKLIDRLKVLEGAIPLQNMEDIFKSTEKEISALDDAEKMWKKLGEDTDNSADKIKVYEKAIEDLIVIQSLLNSKIVEGTGPDGWDKLNDLIRKFKEALDGLKGEETEETVEGLKTISGEVQSLIISFGELVGVSETFAPIIDDIGKKLGDAFENVAVNTLAESFRSLGMVFNSGADASRNLKDALAQQSKALLDMLPTLFISAGLQAMINGNWGLGLTLLALGMTSGMVSGFVQSRIDEETEKNAHGNIYSSSGIHTFAKGSPFTNAIVNTPTYFPFAQGTGLMGEAGPEAIMPLTRTESGDLGVKAVGGNANTNVTVNVSNYSGAEVETRERETPNGRELEVIVGSIVKKQWSQGEYNGVARSTYGLRPIGVR